MVIGATAPMTILFNGVHLLSDLAFSFVAFVFISSYKGAFISVVVLFQAHEHFSCAAEVSTVYIVHFLNLLFFYFLERWLRR
jgi:hypothetical protein